MKPIHARLGAAVALSFAIAACVPSPGSTPTPTPTPAPVATTPSPDPTPAPVLHDNWMDAPRTPGDWSYSSRSGESLALYGEPRSEAVFSLRCNPANRTVTLMRAGQAARSLPLRIRTETADRILAAEPTRGELPYLSASVPARDPILDAMALTKGRFAIEAQGMPTLYLPAWAEVTRVIEDCR